MFWLFSWGCRTKTSQLLTSLPQGEPMHENQLRLLNPLSYSPKAFLQELWRRQPVLSSYGLLMLVLCIPAFAALQLDPRTLRGADIWLKPIRFMLSTGLFALTAAWYMGLLDDKTRDARRFHVMAWVLAGSCGFEVAYITAAASQQIESHYNITDGIHIAMFAAMGVGAVLLTGSQGWLGRQILTAIKSRSVLIWAVGGGLIICSALSMISGFMLSSLRPPEASHVPMLGWSLHGDLRPAHFLAVHAQQFLPLTGWLLQRKMGDRGLKPLAWFMAFYVLLWVILTWQGIDFDYLQQMLQS